jgi:hypothetical protein
MLSPAKASRFARAMKLVMLLACTAFLFGNLAHAGHFHKKALQSGHDDVACQLCMQFDRSAPPPSSKPLAAPSVLLAWVSKADRSSAFLTRRSSRYYARGPPQL